MSFNSGESAFVPKAIRGKISLVLALLAYALAHELHLCFLMPFAIKIPNFEPKTNESIISSTGTNSFESHWLLYSELEEGRYDAIEKANKAPTKIPKEGEWLISKPDYDREAHYRMHGQLIPKRLHKVFLSTTGTYSRLVENVLLELNSTRTENYLKPDVKKVQGEELLIYGHISWKKYNPSYEIRYLNLHQCRSYLEKNFHPLFLRAFDCIEAFSGKTNFMRYLLIYREGGFYSDWKQVCRKEGLLDWLSDDNTTWFSALDDGLKEGSMQTNFFGASPHSPVMREAIRLILHNAQSRLDLNPDFSA